MTINKPLTLQGANHGVSGTSASRTAESIVDGTTNNGETPFDVTANGVTIDGFTIQGATNANDLGFGVVLGAGTSGSTIENNIIQNNIAGLSLANNPNGNPTVVRDNLFQNNNQAGPISGTAIYTDQFNAGGALANVVIDSNTFLNNQDTAVNFASSSPASQTNITITNNVMTNDGNAVFLADTNGAVISGNTISGSIGSQVVLAGGDANVQITQNFIQNGATNGILILEDAADGYTTTNSSDTINDNSISGNATSGLTIDSGAGAYTGTLDAANNWWGSPSGPTTPANPAGTGDKIIDPNNQVNFSPFLTSGTDSQPNTPGFQPAANAANALVVNGSAGNVTVVVTATGPDSGSYTINGGTPIPFSDIASFTFIGGTNDVLVIDNPPGALFAPPGGVFYDGSGSGDSLQIEGGDAMTETFTFSPNEANGQHDGAIALTEGTVTADYTYTNLSPVLVNAGTPNDVVFNLPNNGQDNQAVIQPSGTAGMSEIVSQDGGFETTTFANPINSLTINAAGPAGQTITVGALPGGAVTLVNGAGVGVLDFNAGDQAVGTITGTLTVAGRVALQYGGVVQINLDNAAAVGAVAGPNTTDRDTAFTGLTAQERFVQASTSTSWGGPARRPNWTSGSPCSTERASPSSRPRPRSPSTSNTAWRRATTWSAAGTSPSSAGMRSAARNRAGWPRCKGRPRNRCSANSWRPPSSTTTPKRCSRPGRRISGTWRRCIRYC